MDALVQRLFPSSRSITHQGQIGRILLPLIGLLACCLLPSGSLWAAEYRTPNFVVTAPTEAFAKEVALTAEQWRVRLAQEWLGRTVPNWFRPCPIRVQVGQIGAGGATTFNFQRNPKTGQTEVYGWRMNVQGTAERILDSVIPHEVSHTIFASHFRRPLPRWADEGAATLVEHESEKNRQLLLLRQVWRTPGRIPLKSLLGMKEYPTDMKDVMTLYAEGYSLADFLVQLGGKRRYLDFLDAAAGGDWDDAIRNYYQFAGIDGLDQKWGAWIIAGSPDLTRNGTLLAAGQTPDRNKVTIRAQNEDTPAATEPPPFPTVAGLEQNAATATFGPADFAPKSLTDAATHLATLSQESHEPKRDRPAPLKSFLTHDQLPDGPLTPRRPRGATETGFQSEANPNARPLPRTIRAEPNPREGDFFTPRQSASAAPLGPGHFPGENAGETQGSAIGFR